MIIRLYNINDTQTVHSNKKSKSGANGSKKKNETGRHPTHFEGTAISKIVPADLIEGKEGEQPLDRMSKEHLYPFMKVHNISRTKGNRLADEKVEVRKFCKGLDCKYKYIPRSIH